MEQRAQDRAAAEEAAAAKAREQRDEAVDKMSV